MTIQTQPQSQTAKRTFGAVFAFYFLIAFEFVYMASPFAVYFYSVYQPGLSFLNRIPGISWLGSIFMPHIVVETKSSLLDAHNVIGAVLALTGFLAFCICAAQVYYHKLALKTAVTSGLYRHIRHRAWHPAQTSVPRQSLCHLQPPVSQRFSHTTRRRHAGTHPTNRVG